MRRRDRPQSGCRRRISRWVTPRQAADYLGVGVDTIYEACAAADLKHVKLGLPYHPASPRMDRPLG